MKLRSGKRIGQSGQELKASVIFSFFLHVIFLATALFLYTNVPKRDIPPVYDVKLVSQPREVAQAASKAEPLPAPPKTPEKAPPKEESAPQKELKPPAKKGDMPELAKPKPKPKPKQETSPEQQAKPQQAAPAAPAPSVERGGAATSVDVEMPSGFERSEFSFYAAQLKSKIAANWKHLPVPKDTRAKVVFTILRSGLVEDVKLEETSGNFQFDQAAIRAIRSASPFPRLPEDFYKPFAVFSAYLMPE